jgi:hypothetical protein
MIERLRNTPTHLCRLRYFGGDEWGFAFYAYSSEKYELAVFPMVVFGVSRKMPLPRLLCIWSKL